MGDFKVLQVGSDDGYYKENPQIMTDLIYRAGRSNCNQLPQSSGPDQIREILCLNQPPPPFFQPHQFRGVPEAANGVGAGSGGLALQSVGLCPLADLGPPRCLPWPPPWVWCLGWWSSGWGDAQGFTCSQEVSGCQLPADTVEQTFSDVHEEYTLSRIVRRSHRQTAPASRSKVSDPRGVGKSSFQSYHDDS